MQSTQSHWDQIFEQKHNAQLGWFEPDFYQTFKFIEPLHLTAQHKVFLPGIGTSHIAQQLAKLGCQLILNDISQTAINTTKQGLIEQEVNQQAQFIQQNIAEPLSLDLPVDLWLDRAVLHFLRTEQEIQGYFNNLKNNLKVGGHVLLAQFSSTGANKCAGLELTQYNIEMFKQRLGESFSLETHENYTFINPFGQERPYIYGFFKRCK